MYIEGWIDNQCTMRITSSNEADVMDWWNVEWESWTGKTLWF